MSPHIVLVGDGVESWLMACGLAHKLRPQYDNAPPPQVTLVLRPMRDMPVLHLSPDDLLLFQDIAISERDLVSHCNGQFALGYNYAHSPELLPGNYVCWGGYGFKHKSFGFHQLWTKARDGGNADKFHDYCFAAHCAAANKFVHPQHDPRSVLSTLSHSVVVDTVLLKKYLVARAQNLGVQVCAALNPVTVEYSSERVKSIMADAALPLVPDVCLDFTGEIVANTSRQTANLKLPFNSLVSVRSPENQPKNHSQMAPTEGGWMRCDFLGDQRIWSFWYDRDHLDSAAAETLLLNLDETATETSGDDYPRQATTEHWQGNTIFCGSRATGVANFVHSGMHLLHRQLQTFLQLLPRPNTDVEEWALLQAEYNDFSRVLVARAAEIQWLHAKTVGAAPVEVQQSLQQLTRLFRTRGSVMHLRESLLTDETWVKVLLALDLLPQSHDPLLDRVVFAPIVQKMAQGKVALQQAVAQLPPLQVYRQHYLNR